MTQPRLADILDVDNLRRHVAAGHIAEKFGPDGLRLYDYTQRAQWERVWDRETLTCRGLVVEGDYVQSRPFGKFFNLSEHDLDGMPPIPAEPFTVHEKVDGSLIIVSRRLDGSHLFTTRGSFESKQAVAAKAEFERLASFHPDLAVPFGETWLFEFVAPWNRIVIDYGGDTELVWLARLDNATGSDLPRPEVWPGTAAATVTFNDIAAVSDHCLTLSDDEEGFVVRFESGLRVKVKGAEYLRLHKLLTGVSARTIWQLLADGRTIADLLDRVPDEFASWVQDTADEILGDFCLIEGDARERWASVADLPTRKEQALAIADFPHRSVVFAMLDGKPWQPALWRQVKPAAERPFVTDDVTEAMPVPA